MAFKYQRSLDLAKASIRSLEERMAAQDRTVRQVQRTLTHQEIQEAAAKRQAYPKRLFLEIKELRKLDSCLEEQKSKRDLMQKLLSNYARQQS